MGLITWIKEKFKMLFKTDAEKAFGAETYLSPEMDAAIKLWGQLENGKPPWVKDDTRTIRFSNTVARELAKLITQNIDIKVQAKYGTGETAKRIQKAIDDYFLKNAQRIMQDVIMLGGSMAKWNGKGMDYIPPDRFLVTEFDSNGEVTGVIFFSYYQKEKKFYTRAEWHRFEDGERRDEAGESVSVRAYRVSNKAFVSDNQDEIGRPTDLKNTKWADIVPEFTAENLEKPLFVYIKNPYSNTIDPDSPLGVSCFSECIEELRWLDIAMSTLGVETEDSEPKMIVGQSAIQYAQNNGIELPRMVLKTGLDDMTDKPFEQWQPTLQVASRTDGINFLLSIISYKTGFDPGYFVFNGQAISVATATQVEATERRTINTVGDYRDILSCPDSNGDGRIGAIHDIAYIMDAMSVINGESAPSEFGNYEIYADFADLTRNAEEDRSRALLLTDKGFYPKWYYLVHNEGFTEEEARAIVAEAKSENEPKEGLFGEE
jgi:A118 family predicted phage portal protein